jgi:hypothetical protein
VTRPFEKISQPRASRPAETRSSARRKNGRTSHLNRDRVWVVSDELPPEMPILPAEIEVIETYLGALLDELLAQYALGSSRLPPTASSGTLPGKEDTE